MPPNSKPRGYSFITSVKNIYYDPWKWQLVKSWSWFAAGIYLAREITAGMNEVPLQPPGL